MKKFILMACVIFTCAGLSACVPALIGGGAAGGYYYGKNKPAVDNYTSDSYITSKVKGKLLGDAGLKSFNISVATTHQVVTLTGRVTNTYLRARAGHIARSTKGVVGVVNNIIVSPY